MIDAIMIFFGGLILGAVLGVSVMALCVISGDDDEVCFEFFDFTDYKEEKE